MLKQLARLTRLSRTALRHGPRLLGRLPQAWRVFRLAGWQGVDWELRRRVRATNDYAKWVAQYDTMTPARRSAIVHRVAALASKPLISKSAASLQKMRRAR